MRISRDPRDGSSQFGQASAAVSHIELLPPLARPETSVSMRHYHPARWPPDDSLGRAPPDPFAQPRMTVGPHDQEIDASYLGLRLEYLADGTSINPHHFEACVDAVFDQMADYCRSRLLLRQRVAVGRCDDLHIASTAQHRQCIANGSCSRRAMVPGNHNSVEVDRQLGSQFFRAQQDRSA